MTEGKRIHDVTPPYSIKQVETDLLMNELWERRVSIKTIFGRYYELDEIASHRVDTDTDEDVRKYPVLQIGDTELAGINLDLPDEPLPRQPF